MEYRKQISGNRKQKKENSDQNKKENRTIEILQTKGNFGWPEEMLVFFAAALTGVTQCSSAWGRGSIA